MVHISKAALALVALIAFAIPAVSADDSDPWPSLRSDLFAARPIADAGEALVLEAPIRAEDAAIVPITVKIPAAIGAIKSLTLVVDKNPAPVAAVFTFGPAAGTGDRSISTRLRFDNYSNLRAIIEKPDGSLLMISRFVKGAGGCSAPSLKDADEAMANLGKSQVRLIASPEAPASMKLAQVMVRHPNYSGMQMDQVTGYFIPAKYVSRMDVRRDGESIFQLEAGISLSADPNIRFTYANGTSNQIAAIITDSDARVFTAQSSGGGS
jgi:sulfur-oxidizing protein SoxY